MAEVVNFISDGLRLSPSEFAQVLSDCAQSGEIQQDSYALGGVVEEAEAKFAQLLGKEQAVFMPTGTMANHIALRQLAGSQGKVIVQADSHIYRDIGDSAQTLSGLNLIPLASGRVGFTLDEVEGVVASLVSERVATRVKAISIESPVRRHEDAIFGYDEIERISQFARQHEIRMHLDGARLFVEAAHCGIEPAKIAAHFDTVFVSLSKCFNSASGAILAGPAADMGGLFHTRRMFGGSLPQAWPQAAVALHYADGFLASYRTAWQIADELFGLLDQQTGLRVERIPNGTHIVKLHVANTDLESFRDRLHDHQVHLPPVVPGETWFTLKVNPSMNGRQAQDVAAAFHAALHPAG
ncbi:MAG: amino acid lyase [Gemmatimonadetes bacterium]|jgi:threonine aldolase|nr:amino acid lyase [Gemmatimonadota bacterium]MBT6148067.1 amino acid lyase [Gemmatimonadota bacterium]MBT7861898.1 amino acid lyase [Gemmatimonadota bacterium]